MSHGTHLNESRHRTHVHESRHTSERVMSQGFDDSMALVHMKVAMYMSKRHGTHLNMSCRRAHVHESRYTSERVTSQGLEVRMALVQMKVAGAQVNASLHTSQRVMLQGTCGCITLHI